MGGLMYMYMYVYVCIYYYFYILDYTDRKDE
jgi:hypothetical protein